MKCASLVLSLDRLCFGVFEGVLKQMENLLYCSIKFLSSVMEILLFFDNPSPFIIWLLRNEGKILPHKIEFHAFTYSEQGLDFRDHEKIPIAQ